MKRFLTVVSIITFLFFLFFKTEAQSNQVVVNGTATSPINFAAAGCNYKWINNTPGIGLPDSGTGNIPSFISVNTSKTPVTAIITATALPVDSGYEYIPNTSGNVSVISRATNTLVANIQVGTNPWGVSVSRDGSRVYISNSGSDNVSVINTANNMVIATIPVAGHPIGLCLSHDGSHLYVIDIQDVSIINTLTNTLDTTVFVGSTPTMACVSPNDSLLYLTNFANQGTVTVFDLSSLIIIDTIPVGSFPFGIVERPDGTYIYVANEGSNSITVIDGTTNTQEGTFSYNGGGGQEMLALSADGSLLYITNNTSNTVTVSNTITGAQTTIPVGSGPTGMSLSPDGLTLYVINETSATVSVINTASNTVVATTNISPNSFSFGNFVSGSPVCGTITFSITVIPSPTADTIPNQTVANGASTAQVNFTGAGCTYKWVNNTPTIGLADSSTGNITSFTAINNGSSPVTATITATPIPTGYAYIPNGGSNYVYVIDTTTNRVMDSIAVSSPVGVTVSPDGKFVYVTNNNSNGTVSVISTVTNTEVATIPVGSSPYGIAVNPDGKFLYVACSSGVSVISTATNAVIATIEVGPNIGIAVSPDGSLVYVTCNNDTIYVISTATNTVVATISVGIDPTDICFSPNGSLVYVTNTGDNTISVINASTNTVVATIPVGLNPYCVTVSPNGSLVYVTNSTSNTVSVINASTNTVVATLPAGKSPTGLSFSSSGSRLYVLNQNPNAITVLNTSTNSAISTIPLSGVDNLFAIGNFISAGPGCNSSAIMFTITVNPTLTVISAGMVTGSISACEGAASASPDIQQFTVSGTNLLAGITATVPPGFQVSLAASSGYGDSVIIPPTGGVIDSTIVYVQSSASAPSGSISGNVMLSSTGAASQGVTVSGVINAQPASSVTVTASANDICAGIPVTFTAVATNGGSAPAYQWLVNGIDSGSNSPDFTSSALNNGDSVDCIMTGSMTCSGPVSSSAVYMIINPLPTVAFNPDTVFIKDNTGVQLAPTISGSIAQYQWSPVDGLSNTSIAGPFADPDTSSIYQLFVTTDSGCTATGKIVVIPVRPIEMPSAFTPNGDGHNDVFRIPPQDQLILQEFDIFNRWGGRVFTTRNISEGWSGIFNGKAADAGTYVYMITGKTLTGEPVLLKGTVVLIR